MFLMDTCKEQETSDDDTLSHVLRELRGPFEVIQFQPIIQLVIHLEMVAILV